ncbi:MAG: amidohydrolase family protein [Spirochaetota bacterium]
MNNKMYRHLYEYLEHTPVISTHEHHLEDRDHQKLTLEGIIEHSYVSWQGIPPGSSKEEHAEFLERVRYNSYFVWLEKALKKIYRFNGTITPDFWDDLSTRIQEKHRENDFHLRILKEHCRYKAGVCDIYWDPGSDLGHPQLFKPVVRSDVFLTCYHPQVRDHDDNSPWKFFDVQGLGFDEYVDFILNFHRKKIQAGAVAFKIATAYERPISIQEPCYEKAAGVYLQEPENVSDFDKMAYGDYLVHRICALAQELEVPIQVHTGLGELKGSNPMLLEPLIQTYPHTRFVLFHGGYPWYSQVGALAHNHPNVLVDMVWLPLISTSAAKQALDQYIEVVPSSDRIAWGSDAWTSEEALGALLAYQHVVASVLAEKVEYGYLGKDDAEILAQKLMYKNASQIYGIDTSTS